MNVATDDATSAPITIVLNWAAGLTKGTILTLFQATIRPA